MSFWARTVLPYLIEKACRSRSILEERQRRVPMAHGRVLEVGIGTGLNLPFYDATRATELVAIDPSPALIEKTRTRLDTCAIPVELMAASVCQLPLDNASFDSIVMTYTLCSVEDPIRALRELHRVLRPNGELLFVEHGLARDPSTRFWQKSITPVWRHISGNCHLDRDITIALRETGFHTKELEEHEGEGFRITGYTYEGTATPA